MRREDQAAVWAGASNKMLLLEIWFVMVLGHLVLQGFLEFFTEATVIAIDSFRHGKDCIPENPSLSLTKQCVPVAAQA